MLTVSVDPVEVESQLLVGGLSCPSCSGVVGPWGWARPRMIGRADLVERVVPRRGRCRSCRTTHVLLPRAGLLRRCDWVVLIGRALELAAIGTACRAIGRQLGVPRSTVRGWLARFERRAERVRQHFTRWLAWLVPGWSRIEAAGSPAGDAVAVIGTAGQVAQPALEVTVWVFAATATGGRLLCNTSAPFPAPWAA